MKKGGAGYLAWGLLIVAFFGLLFFYPRDDIDTRVILENIEADIEANEAVVDSVGWRDVKLKDVVSGEVFSISDFDRPIVLESFAVWCPTCKQQQDQIQKLINSGDDSFHISINTDPNEDEGKVIGYVERYGYTWSFTIFPADATRMLIDEFGIGVVNAPRTPVILICPSGESRLLRGGVKSAEELREEIATC